MSPRSPSRWKARSPPCRRSLSRVWSKAGCRHEGGTGSSMARIWLSVGTAVMPNRLWQFDVFRPSTSALVGEEGFALHEEQREGRQADIGHAVGHVAAPLVGKGRAGRANALQKSLKHLHAGLNHTSGRSETRFY